MSEVLFGGSNKAGAAVQVSELRLEAHRDAIGAQNIRLVHEGRGGVDNRVVAPHPLLLSVRAGTQLL